MTSKDGDFVNALETGPYAGGGNLVEQSIYFECDEGTKINLGTKNKLASVNFNGATAGKGGGNATTSYSYTTFNDFLVQHSADPTVALRA